MPAGTGDRDEPQPPLASDRVQDVLQLAQLLLAADERRLERIRAALPAPLGDDAQRAPGRHGRGLALQRVVARAASNTIAPSAALHGRLADEHGPGLGDALEAGGGVHEVAGDHALVGRVRA